MKINKLFTKLKSFLFGKTTKDIDKEQNGFCNPEIEKVNNYRVIKYKSVRTYYNPFFEGRSADGFSFHKRYSSQLKHKINRLHISKRTKLKHKKAA